eukprot:Tbor_TRINITY_DN4743_c1_g2::TRINITY_DN4743_c1_g2_i1::g.17027::m.17027
MSFGCLIPGRMPITSFQIDHISNGTVSFSSVSSTKWRAWVDHIPEQVVVFLTGTEPLPTGTAMAVFISCDNSAASSTISPFEPQASSVSENYFYLGCVTNETPSAIFRIPITAMISTPSGGIAGITYTTSNNPCAQTCTLGLSLETTDTVANLSQTVAQPTQQYHVSILTYVAQRITRDFMRFIYSYTRNQVDPVTNSQEGEIVQLPVNWIQKWEQRFMSRVQKDANYFVSSED